jgi:translocation protein SEC63
MRFIIFVFVFVLRLRFRFRLRFLSRPHFGPEEAEKARLVNRKGRWVYIKLLFALALCGLAFKLVNLVHAHGIVAKFDPFEILQIQDREANVSFIKKQYRKLSLIYHPDKNIGPKAVAAGEMFQKIAKAYEALTDETSKENWEKYGNPDGKQVS